jgi:hypothetical protein
MTRFTKYEAAVDPRVEELLDAAISSEAQGLDEEAEDLRAEAKQISVGMARQFVRFGGMI